METRGILKDINTSKEELVEELELALAKETTEMLGIRSNTFCEIL